MLTSAANGAVRGPRKLRNAMIGRPGKRDVPLAERPPRDGRSQPYSGCGPMSNSRRHEARDNTQTVRPGLPLPWRLACEARAHEGRFSAVVGGLLGRRDGVGRREEPSRDGSGFRAHGSHQRFHRLLGHAVARALASAPGLAGVCPAALEDSHRSGWPSRSGLWRCGHVCVIWIAKVRAAGSSHQQWRLFMRQRPGAGAPANP